MNSCDLIKARAAQIRREWDELEPFETAEQALSWYEEKEEECGGYFQDALSDVRCGGFETNIRPESSRHYETKAVATEIFGQWVGWTYFYGGGKYGEPESYDWHGNSYLLSVAKEEIVTVIKREFAMVETLRVVK